MNHVHSGDTNRGKAAAWSRVYPGARASCAWAHLQHSSRKE